VSVTPWENVQELIRLELRARLGAKAAAEAMARYVAERAAYDTLQRTSHGVGEYWKAAPGVPPASASGNLAASMFWTRAQGSSTRARAYAGNSARYAKMLEFGCHPVRPTRGKVMHWSDSGGEWYHAVLPADGSDMPEHPFLGPTTDEAVEDGELRRVAMEAFEEYDP
jgi:hypothetical protein